MERRSTTTPTFTSAFIFPNYAVGSAHTVTGQVAVAHSLLSAAYSVPTFPDLSLDFYRQAMISWGENSVTNTKRQSEVSERAHEHSSRDVPLHVVLEIGSLLAGTLAVGSIAAWLLGGSPLLNPFTAMLTLIASPFFFAMGRLARRNRAR